VQHVLHLESLSNSNLLLATAAPAAFSLHKIFWHKAATVAQCAGRSSNLNWEGRQSLLLLSGWSTVQLQQLAHNKLTAIHRM
jgi:hypothetical protein